MHTVYCASLSEFYLHYFGDCEWLQLLTTVVRNTVVWCGADWNLRQQDARLLYAPAKLGAGCSLMALAGLVAILV